MPIAYHAIHATIPLATTLALIACVKSHARKIAVRFLNVRNATHACVSYAKIAVGNARCAIIAIAKTARIATIARIARDANPHATIAGIIAKSVPHVPNASNALHVTAKTAQTNA